MTLSFYTIIWTLSTFFKLINFLTYVKIFKYIITFYLDQFKSSPKSCVKLSAQYLMVLHLDIISRSIFPLFRLIYQ